MTDATTHQGAGPGALDRTALRRVTAVLSVTEITSWGVLYYAFPVLLTSINGETGWGLMPLAGAFSASQAISALIGLVVGRIIDRHGPRVVMTCGSVLTVPALLLIALAPTYLVFFMGWMLVGVAMAAVLYPPAFAALTHWGGTSRVRALTTLTLVAGLASTVFAPMAAILNTYLGWRGTYLVLAAVLVLVTVPAHWFGLRATWTPAERPQQGGEAVARVWLTRPFLLLALSTSATAFTIYAVLINLVPLLVDRGLSTEQAASALGIGGIGQVAGRLGYARFAACVPTVARTAMVIVGVAASTALFAVIPGPTLALFAISVLAGVSRGIFTLIKATAVSDRWGVTGFGKLNAILTAPALLAAAVAPFAGVAIATATGSQRSAFLILAVISLAAAATALGTTPTADAIALAEHPAEKP